MLCLYAPDSPTRRSYRAVLEVSPINFSLKAEEEQEAIIERFGALIRSLSFPLQILVRNQRQDLAPYIQCLLEQPNGQLQHPPTWYALARSLADLLQKIASQRTLIERHVYVVIPASQGAGSSQRRKGFPSPFGKRKAQRAAETEEQARAELVLRAEALAQQLASRGFTCHRLHNAELARLAYSCLTPERAIAYPLSGQLLSSVGRPTRVKRREARISGSQMVREVGSEHQRAPSSSVIDQAERALPQPDLLPLVDLLAPECIEVTPDALRVGQEYACGLVVTACPREVSFDSWLAPLFLHDEVMDISFHYHPQDAATMKGQMVRHRTGHASGRRFNRREGRADDPDALVAEEDISRLLDDLARSRERVFDLGFYLLLRASNPQALAERVERLYSVLGLLSLDGAAHPATFEQVELLQSCLPQARDELLRTTTLDSTTLATMFPFQSNSLSMPGGVLVGVSETHEPVLLNPWNNELENPHLFIGGVTGSGKSYLGKLLVERDLLLNCQRGDQCFVIDPDLEYQQLAEALGGTVVRLAPGSMHKLNPFDLLPPRFDFGTYLVEASKGDRLAEKIQDLHAMLDIILAEDAIASSSGGGMLTKREKGLLDRALYETYRRVGITGDPRTHQRHPPLLYQLYELLKSCLCGPDETDLAGRLYRYVSGSLSSLFSDVTSVDLASHLVVWDIRDMRSELRPLAISLIHLDPLVPTWLLQSGLSLLHGKTLQFSSAHLVALAIGGGIALVALFCLAFFVLQVRNRVVSIPMYNMHLVDEKTARSAYRVRLRLFVFSNEVGKAATHPVIAAHATRSSKQIRQRLFQSPFVWSILKDVYNIWRHTAYRDEQRRQEQRDVLDHLVAAYRQYHMASGGYFVSRQIKNGKAKRLLTRKKDWMNIQRTGWQHDLARSSHVLSVADIASLWHLPQAQDLFDLPYVERARARTTLVPAELTRGNGWKIGTSSHAGHSVPVFLPQGRLRHNLLAVASTGKGKSTLFQHLAQAVCARRSDSERTNAPGLAFI
jgi:hypothetical protein